MALKSQPWLEKSTSPKKKNTCLTSLVGMEVLKGPIMKGKANLIEHGPRGRHVVSHFYDRHCTQIWIVLLNFNFKHLTLRGYRRLD